MCLAETLATKTSVIERMTVWLTYCTSASLPSWVLEKKDGLAEQPSSTCRGDVAISVIAIPDAGKR